MFSVQIEGGKYNNSDLQIDITGTEGDLKGWNSSSFGNVEDNIIEGAQGDQDALEMLRLGRTLPQTGQRLRTPLRNPRWIPQLRLRMAHAHKRIQIT